MRRFLIAGNWKMNCGPAETAELLHNIRKQCPAIPDEVDVLVCPPEISLTTASKALKGYDIFLGAQNMHYEDNGAFTGEVSTQMLKEAGCMFVIVGHSERRTYFGEDDHTVNKKAVKALKDGLQPVICVGESLEQRKKGEHRRVVEQQVKAALDGITAKAAGSLVIAYEPVWAIGTGETATPEQAQEMHAMIRGVIARLYDQKTADAIRILYGGSMKPQNAEDLLSRPDVDGGLIGGASLQAKSFVEIISIAHTLA